MPNTLRPRLHCPPNARLAICLGIGVAIGVATDQLAVWLAIGCAVGLMGRR
jgi:hypothetical protein